MEALGKALLIFGGLVVLFSLMIPVGREFKKRTGISLFDIIIYAFFFILALVVFGFLAIGSVIIGIRENSSFLVLIGLVCGGVVIILIFIVVSGKRTPKDKDQIE